MKNNTLIIWFKNGTTAYFEQVKGTDLQNNCLTFEYFCMASKVKRGACFTLENIAGFATDDV